MTREELVDEMKREFLGAPGSDGQRARRARRYVGGLLPSFCDFLIELDAPQRGYESLDDLFSEYPQITEGVSTLTLALPDDRQKTIRPAYERYHHHYVTENRRLDYPRSAPYATGKWGDYRHWLDALVGMSKEDLEWVAQSCVAFVLGELKEHRFYPSSVRAEPPIFKWLPSDFDFGDRAPGEPTGAAFQAVVFGYVRADAPHLQVEARKARAGSARTQGIGDIDAWEGDQLIVSAEVKHFVVGANDLGDFTHFAANIAERAALGLVVAEDFASDVRAQIEELGLHPLSRLDLLRIVSLWDPLKQRAALNAFQWVVVHKEQNSGLIERVRAFLEQVGYRPGHATADEAGATGKGGAG